MNLYICFGSSKSFSFIFELKKLIFFFFYILEIRIYINN